MRAIFSHAGVACRSHSELCVSPRALACEKLACIATLASLVVVVGCSHRGAYEAVQHNRLNACNEEPTPELRADCRARNSATYEDYQRARDDLLVEETTDAE